MPKFEKYRRSTQIKENNYLKTMYIFFLVNPEIINNRDRNTYVFVCYHTAKWLQNENFLSVRSFC